MTRKLDTGCGGVIGIVGNGRNEMIGRDGFESLKDELRGGGAGSPFTNLITESKGFGDGEEREDGEEGSSFFQGFRKDPPSSTGDDGVDFS